MVDGGIHIGLKSQLSRVRLPSGVPSAKVRSETVPKVGIVIKIEVMKERIYKRLIADGFTPLSGLVLKAIARSINDELKELAAENPNDLDFGCKFRKLINE